MRKSLICFFRLSSSHLDNNKQESIKLKFLLAIIPYTQTEATRAHVLSIFLSRFAPALVFYIIFLIFIAKLLNIVILYRISGNNICCSLRSPHRRNVENPVSVCWAIKHNKHQSLEIDTHMIFNVFASLLAICFSWGKLSWHVGRRGFEFINY